ncbi:MAG: TIGR01777 family oxidoreductase [Flavobacteriales bacterium]|nr:TIGR01777 family oxidoreductase [Flavobacteriales bacterium]
MITATKPTPTSTLERDPAHIVLAGGTGTMGRILQRHFVAQGWRVTVLTRRPEAHSRDEVSFVHWDGRSVGPWSALLDSADVLVNLAGRSVDCRYTEHNKAAILNSRVDATNALGLAMDECTTPPTLWINLSSATVYRHAEDREMDEETGELGRDFSPQVVLAWEKAFFGHQRNGLRQVAVRCAMVFSHEGGAFPRFVQLVKAGLGGHHGPGTQYVSWVHEADVARFFQWVIDTSAIHGVINLAAPCPVTDRTLTRALRERIRPLVALPTPVPLLHLGSFVLRTEVELVLKSRRVVPMRALYHGFAFTHPTLANALDELLPTNSTSKPCT